MVVYRRTAFELRKAEERAHIIEGLMIAINNLDEVVELIKAASDPAEAKAQLMAKYELTAIQAQTVLDMRLQRLTGLEREKIARDYEEIVAEIERLNAILNDEQLVMNIIKDEFVEIKETYGDERRTEIIDAADEILPEDLIAPEDMAVTVTHSGYIKRNPLSLYRSQHRGGKGVKGVTNIEEDFVSNLYVASTLDTFLFFTNYGKVFWRKVYQLPLVGRTARGKAIVNLLELTEGEKVAAILPVTDFEDEQGTKTIMMVTKYGRVKKTSLKEFNRPLRKGKRALTINEGDEIITAHMLRGNDTVFMISRDGMSIRFHESDVRPMGRIAAGVRGIRLKGDDFVVGANVLREDSIKTVLVVTANGYGKRSQAEDYRIQHRGGTGIMAIKKSDRNGDVIGAKVVNDDYEAVLIANSGKMIRMPLDTVRVIGRTTQGVRLINLEENEKVVGMDVVEVDPNEDLDSDEPLDE
mgnify:CR=1 FL=1